MLEISLLYVVHFGMVSYVISVFQVGLSCEVIMTTYRRQQEPRRATFSNTTFHP